MSRARRGFKNRRRKVKIRRLAKGFHFDRSTKFKQTLETVRRALHYAYAGRKLLKRDMRRLWIVRIGAASKSLGTSYSRFINALKTKNIVINRKMLADLAVKDFEAFKTIHQTATSK